MNILFLLLLCVTNADNDTTGGKVFDAIAEYALAIESLESDNYAAVCRIKQTTLSSSLGPIDHNRIWVAGMFGGNVWGQSTTAGGLRAAC